jgi:isopentenyl-diphosphate Delta-isomerase
MSERKGEHIKLALKAQTASIESDKRFIYEPLLKPHPSGDLIPFQFLGKELKTPIWASSMTGGTAKAQFINENIARVCKDFGMGMGLGSCRQLLDDDTYLKDFKMRKFIGDKLPFYANLGIAQIDLLLKENKIDKVKKLMEKLHTDGLIVHINPLQEWFQPEGNNIHRAPIDIIEELLNRFEYPVIVKEVGQGMGAISLKRLLQLPLQAIEFGAFGGTNFSLLELLRGEPADLEVFKSFAYVGQTAEQMVNAINQLSGTITLNCREVIISGGIKSFLDGYYLTNKCTIHSIFGMASSILNHATVSYEQLHKFIENQVKGLTLAESYLRINSDYL